MKLKHIQKYAILLWKLIINSKKGIEQFVKNFNVLKINKRGVGRIEKVIRGGGTLIWHMSVTTSFRIKKLLSTILKGHVLEQF